MLKNLIIQGIATFVSIFFSFLAINFFKVRTKSKITFLRSKAICRTLAIICTLLALISAIYFFNYLNTLEHFFVIPCILSFVVAIIVYTLFTWLGWSYNNLHGGYSLILALLTIVIFIFANIADKEYSDYNSNIVQQVPKITTEKYDLFSLSNASVLEGSIEANSSRNHSEVFFIQHTTTETIVNGQIKHVDVYKFYYLANDETGEIRFMTLEADDTPLYFVEEGEKPYLLKRISTPYSLNYNVNPAEICDVGQQTISYELHIPQNSIVEIFEINPNK